MLRWFDKLRIFKDHLKARSAISWNHMAFTIFESRKKGSTQRVEKATDRMGWV